jgi:hypothetical protein
MTSVDLTEVVKQLVGILTPLSSEERKRTIAASFTLLGDGAVISKNLDVGTQQTGDELPAGLPPRVAPWMKQNDISMEELEQVFQIGADGVTVIASDILGKNDKEKTYSAYILAGVAKFLAGSTTFDDTAARELCKSLGCFNRPNHAGYISEKGNEFTGSKDKGWTLTAPGLKRGAAIVKELNKKKND